MNNFGLIANHSPKQILITGSGAISYQHIPEYESS